MDLVNQEYFVRRSTYEIVICSVIALISPVINLPILAFFSAI